MFSLFPSAKSPRRQDYAALRAIRGGMEKLQTETDESLRKKTADLRQKLSVSGSQRRRVLRIQAFALMSEAMRRTSGRIYYDVQLLGGYVLSHGRIAEMQTGEGKTITTALPTFYFALQGRGVHVATTNFYLAERDREDVAPAFDLLGMSVGLLPDEHDPTAKQQAYLCDVTYGTGYEFGFDFLRDQIALRSQRPLKLGQKHLRCMQGLSLAGPDLLQRPHAFAIIDEADSVLIDEATMPLILSSPRSNDSAEFVMRLARQVALNLEPDEHYEFDPATKSITLTDSGWQIAHEPLYRKAVTGLNRPWSQYIAQALRAELVLQRDIDYVLLDGKVAIVDQNTGRIHEERTWRNGLHQSVELKESVQLSPEKASDGRISRQRYFRFYNSVCGMTGTATGNEAEFQSFYHLPVVPIPTHRPSQRKVLPVRAFGNTDARDEAIRNSALQRSRTGQPVLIGTRTIAHSLRLQQLFQQSGIDQTVLNGIQDAEEAHIISQAGQPGTITIATNMAGRGTDIKLTKPALDAGGLHVIGAEPNFSPRVDRQLAGRAARQGQPGSAQFFLSAEDEVLVVSESALANRLRESADDHGHCDFMVDDQLSLLQRRLEQSAFRRRALMFQQDHWMEGVMEVLAKRG